jgi:preprotein translocase subunit SecD
VTVVRWVLVGLVALVGCAEEADDAIPRDTSDSSAPSDGGGSDEGRDVDLRFVPVVATFSCEQRPELVPDHAGELCYELGSDSVGGEVVESADAELDQIGQWQVALVLTESGIGDFNDHLAVACSPPSEACPSGQVAIVLDDEVVSAPSIQQPSFESDDIVITGEFTEDEADEIAEALDG